MTPTPAIALTIAGSDSGGGAGIQADLRTFAALGVHGTSALTAITAQNTCGVSAVHPVPLDMLQAQIDAVFSDMPVAAAKTGMLADSSRVVLVAERLAHWKPGFVVVDPVMIASSGDRLLDAGATQALREQLIPLASVLTPNIPEAEFLLGEQITNRQQQLEAARQLLALGCKAVLLKGGHLPGPRLHDLWLDAEGAMWLSHPMLNIQGHGTGCTLAAALAALLALGQSPRDACRLAVRYLRTCLNSAYLPGAGEAAVLAHNPELRRIQNRLRYKIPTRRTE